MKKLTSALLAFALCLTVFAACSAPVQVDPTTTSAPPEQTTAPITTEATQPDAQPVTIRLAGMTGPTAIGMVKLLKDNADGVSANEYDFTLAGSADEITPKLVQKELDIAAVPANLASVLYNNTEGAIQVLAVNTLGVIYIVEAGDSITDIEDLRGKTIFATGKGSTPEYALNYILAQNGIDPEKDVTIEWKSEPSEAVALIKQGAGTIAMMPQPYVTVAQSAIDGLRIAVDLTKAWDELDSGSSLITGVVVARREFVEQHPQQVAAFLEEYKASAEYVTANVADAAALVEEFGIFKADIAERAIPYCNIVYIDGEQMKAALSGYLKVLLGQNEKSVGGKLPGDDFYYGAK